MKTKTRKYYPQKRNSQIALYGKNVAKAAKKSNPFEYWRWILLGLGLIAFSKLTKKWGEGGLFASLKGLFVPAGSGAADLEMPDSETFETINSNATSNGIQIGKYFVNSSLVNIVQAVYQVINGMNMNSYEQYVNKLADLTTQELFLATLYYNYKYRGSTNKSFYWFIAEEAYTNPFIVNGFGTTKYDPALGAFKKRNWQEL